MRGNGPTAVLFMMDSLLELAGSERNLFEIVTRLEPGKYRPIVMCMRGGSLVNLLRDRGVEVIDLRLKRIYTLPALLTALRAARFLRRNGVKILVTYHEKSDYFGALVAKLAGIPAVISSRRDMGYTLRRPHLLVYRLVNRFFDRIVTVSSAVKGRVAEREKAPWHKLVTIYNGVHCETFARKIPPGPVRKSLGLDKDGPVVGILAVLRPVKGHRYFLEAASLIAKACPRARFLAVGWTPDCGYYDELKALARSLGIGDRVLFTGGRSDTPEMLAAMDVPVFASENEGFSNAVLESMAAGKAVVATNSGGTAEAVVDGVTGLLVPPRDPGALARAVLRLLEDRRRAGEMGKKGRERALSVFGIERMMAGVQNLFDEVLAEKLPARERRPPVPETARRLAGRAAKQLSGNLAYYSGLVRLGRKLPPVRGLRILAYHRVTSDPFVLPGMSVKVSHFEEQLRFLRAHFSLLRLDEAVELLIRGKAPDDAVSVTFDDGYYDNYANAFPLLRRYGVPAAFFLSVNAIEKGGLLWFDEILEGVRRSAACRLDLRGAGRGEYPLGTGEEKRRAAEAAVQYAKTLPPAGRERFIGETLGRLGVERAALADRKLMMSWENVNEMKEHGFCFGSHGMNHEIFSRLTREEMEYEAACSRRVIRERTGIRATAFAYPNGRAGDFTAGSEEVLVNAGFRAVCTLIKGANGAEANCLRLKRFCVTEGMEADIFGRFSGPIFALSLLGASPAQVARGIFAR